ncbi:hypothetical protein PQR62_20375 [Herbaspirillum lusitanum]|jgi:hypothetical protein|uniref:Ribbon-helix-helix protein CopG domain-containing protein n=1 Tax=Herbaspirillum lusitanum TaxID=213312 RepID=A0ABW9ACK0_9BURK
MSTKVHIRGVSPHAGSQPITLRLNADELARTEQHASREQRSRAAFIRLIYLRGLAAYEREQDRERELRGA